MNHKVSLKEMRRKLFLLGVFKIPMIGFIRPKLISLDDESVIVKIKLRRRSRNHLNSMYFGALAVGADIAAGIQAFYFSKRMGDDISLAFKGIKGEFFKRAESDVYFYSNQGSEILDALMDSKTKGERVNLPINIDAKNESGELMAQFELILSVRVKE